MNNSALSLSYSPWYILICVLVGALYAFLLYRKKAPWNKTINWILASLRFLTVTIICLLLLDFIVKKTSSTVEKPSVVLAIDNSASVKLGTDSLQLKKIVSKLKTLETQLKDQGINVITYNLEDIVSDFDSLKFRYPTSDLNELIRNSELDFEGRNLAGMVLLSDGIFNRGLSPAFQSYGTKIYTIPIGDSTRKIDISIKSLGHNRIAYLGNDFPIVAEIENNGFEGKSTRVQLLHNGKLIEEKKISFMSSFGIQEVEFLANASKKGIQQYTVRVLKLSGEFTGKNNRRSAFIDVLENKEKILCIAYAPHPDLKALKAAIEKNDNIEFVLRVFTRGDQPVKDKNFDLVIFHQIPNARNQGNDLIEKYKKEGKSLMFILGNQSQLGRFNSSNSALTISQRRGQIDEVTPSFNQRFDLFTFDEEKRERFNSFPPLQVPFGDYKMKGTGRSVLYQQVGSVVTDKSLIAVNLEGNVKSGVIAGEGIWMWRLHEYMKYQNTDAFDELIQKLTQLLSEKSDKRRFRVYTTRNEYQETDEVIFVAEAFNEIYEQIYDINVSLNVRHKASGKQNQYKFTTSRANSKLKVNGLKPGLYTYSATAKVAGKNLSYGGSFVVRAINLEASNLRADYHLMKKIADQSDGELIMPKDIDKLSKVFSGDNIAGIIHSSVDRVGLINYKWIFFLLLALLAAEWGLRKARGGY